MELIDRLDSREAEYTLKRKSADFVKLLQIINPTNKNVVKFFLHREGSIYSISRRIFSVRDLKEYGGRKKRSILIATRPSKVKGFFIPWDPYSKKGLSEVLQIIYKDRLLYENCVLMENLGVKKNASRH